VLEEEQLQAAEVDIVGADSQKVGSFVLEDIQVVVDVVSTLVVTEGHRMVQEDSLTGVVVHMTVVDMTVVGMTVVDMTVVDMTVVGIVVQQQVGIVAVDQ